MAVTKNYLIETSASSGSKIVYAQLTVTQTLDAVGRRSSLRFHDFKIKIRNANHDSNALLDGKILLKINGTTYATLMSATTSHGSVMVNLSTTAYQTVRDEDLGSSATPWEKTVNNIPHSADGTLSFTVQFENLYIYSPAAAIGGAKLNTSHAITAEPLPGRYTLSLSVGANASGGVKLHSSPYRTAGGDLASGAYIYNGETVQVNFSAASGYEASATVNGSAVSSGETKTVSGNMAVAVTARAMGNAYIKNALYQVFLYANGAWTLTAPYVQSGGAWVIH